MAKNSPSSSPSSSPSPPTAHKIPLLTPISFWVKTKLTKLKDKINMRKSITDEQAPAFQFYASDWISDPNRLKLSLEEQGAYILLFCHAWRGFHIPFDNETIAKMCGCRLQKIEKILPKIKHLFEEVKGKDNKKYLICIQAEAERKEQIKNRKKKVVAGKLGAKIRWGEESLGEEK